MVVIYTVIKLYLNLEVCMSSLNIKLINSTNTDKYAFT